MRNKQAYKTQTYKQIQKCRERMTDRQTHDQKILLKFTQHVYHTWGQTAMKPSLSVTNAHTDTFISFINIRVRVIAAKQLLFSRRSYSMRIVNGDFFSHRKMRSLSARRARFLPGHLKWAESQQSVYICENGARKPADFRLGVSLVPRRLPRLTYDLSRRSFLATG